MRIAISVILFIILGPLIGGLLSGLDRVITAKMQGRVGPPLLQPFYDVSKLLKKETLLVNKTQDFYVFAFLVLIIFTGCLFFAGEDLLLVVFALTLASVLLVLAAFSTSSPYSHMGAERELIQMMSYEPMVIIMTVGVYMITKNFYISKIVAFDKPLIMYLPGVFLGFLYVLTIKFRKSPFDLSMSHHAHQEIVRGITTEFTGKKLAMIEIAHWYENVFLLGFIYLFFANNPVIGIIATLAAFFLEIFIDNSSARVKWEFAMVSSWVVAISLGMVNIAVLYFIG
ncbi:respiratory chain complex I subunit 1 family protein [Acetivibrio clariflavus]|uniref:Formate hydrogenlyase subunit 4 n=1 Tax=Acetivibrio clariflavus (strain DSM 19732 / NBRC 101661 / EBR45) TaxID=720554 RepID=G8LX03_ACECE|nr:complex I subunit 1 family protein [Acetivibrio clariflavus]AEV67655.1 formate hydrogenlyase subunit 4 [Acetivibrio clariflavus DSM 19732]